MQSPGFSPGFRLSVVDVVVLILGAAATIALASMTWWWGFVVGFVLLHFFLFCNVFRIARPLELVWAAIFVTLSSGTIVIDVPGWPATIAMSLISTVVVVAIEIRKPSYHGVGWRRINPALPDWWQSRVNRNTPCESTDSTGPRKESSTLPTAL